jgi:hypothetical protein
VAWWVWLLVVWPAATVLVGIVLGKMISRAEAGGDQHPLEAGEARTETALSLSRTLRSIPRRQPRRRGRLLDGA